MSRAAHPAFIRYPPQAAYGKPVPKARIYEHAGVSARIKDLFVRDVDQIVWQYKLAPETLNLPARPGVPEIQVFTLKVRTPELSRDVLRCIDKAVQFPIIFELAHDFELIHDGRTQVVACYKRPGESDASRWVCSEYFATDWLPSEGARAELPSVLDMAGLYEQLLQGLSPIKARLGEPLSDLVSRIEKARAAQREVDRTVSRLAKETQFNRKVEINATLRQLKAELEQLTN